MASYSQFSIQDRPKLKRYILMKLGGGLITLPITDEQLEFCIDEALEEFTKWVHYDLDYFVLDVKNVTLITKDNPNGTYCPQRGFKLPDEIVAVSNIHETDNFWFQGDGSMADFVFFNSGMYPTTSMFNGSNFYGNGMFLDVWLAQDYIKQAQQLFGYKYNFNYNERSKFLKLDPDPQKRREGKSCVMLEVHTIRPEDQLVGEANVKKLALANAMMMMGNTLKTFGSGVNLPGGGNINGDDMYSNGKELYDTTLEELKQTQPPNFFFTQA
jgi:hypothetical protein